MWTQDMFGVEKPIIALLHLDALPGDPGYCGDMKTVTEHARKDLLALQDGGVDGILFANEFSLPYQPEEAVFQEHIWENMEYMSRTAEKRSVTEKRSESKI